MFAPAQSRDLAQRIQLLADAGSPYEMAVRQIVGRVHAQPDSSLDQLPGWAHGLLGLNIGPEPAGLTAQMRQLRTTMLRSTITRASTKLEFGWNPAQARVPKGNTGGGEWLDMVTAVVGNLTEWLTGIGGNNEGEAGPLVEDTGRDVNRDRLDASMSPKKIRNMQGSYVSRDRLTPEGKFNGEAIKDQDATIAKTLQGVKPVPEGEQKIVYFNIGGPGSGKGGNTGVNREIIGWPKTREIDDMTGEPDFEGMPNPDAALLDADAMKIQHPNVKKMRRDQSSHGVMNDPDALGGMWAGESHEESSYMNKLAYTRALEAGVPIVFDGTGDGGIESVREKVEEARKHGYIVKAAGVYLEPTEGLKRATSRAASTGRNVPPKMQAATYADIVDTFNAAKDENLFDSIVWLDNNGVNKGETAKPIYEFTSGGGLKILDQAAWDRFQSSKDRLPSTGEYA
jgi:hypothetical protein